MRELRAAVHIMKSRGPRTEVTIICKRAQQSVKAKFEAQKEGAKRV